MAREAARPVTQADYDQIRALHAQGLGRNEIMRQTSRSANVVSRVARELGLSFTRGPEITAATQARAIDLAARRIALATDLHEDAERLRAQLWRPAIVYNFGGKDNTYEEHHVPEPPAADKKAIMSTVGMAVDRSLKLAPPRTDDGTEEVGSLLTSLFDRLRDRHGDG